MYIVCGGFTRGSVRSPISKAFLSSYCRRTLIDQEIKMAKKSKLLAALDAHKGRNYKLEKQRQQERQAEKRSQRKLQQVSTHEDKNGGTENMDIDEPNIEVERSRIEGDKIRAV